MRILCIQVWFWITYMTIISCFLIDQSTRLFPLKWFVYTTNRFGTRNVNSRWHDGFFFLHASLWPLWGWRTLWLNYITSAALVCPWVFFWYTFHHCGKTEVFGEFLMRPHPASWSPLQMPHCISYGLYLMQSFCIRSIWFHCNGCKIKSWLSYKK